MEDAVTKTKAARDASHCCCCNWVVMSEVDNIKLRFHHSKKKKVSSLLIQCCCCFVGAVCSYVEM